MRCNSARAIMTRQQSETLPEDMAARLARHLLACQSCRMERMAIHKLVGDVKLQASAGAAAAFPMKRPDTAAILSRSNRGVATESASWRSLALGAAAFATAIAILA